MWEERYKQAKGYFFGTEPAQFLRENPGWYKSGQQVLVVADGEGRNSVHIASTGANVRTFDLSATALARARALAVDRGVYVDANLSLWQDWNWDQTQYDLVVAVFIQYTGPEARKQQFNDIKQSVKPGGHLMLHGYRPEQITLGTGGPSAVENMYTEGFLRESFADWQIKRLASYERDVEEGHGHSGKSALIDLIARKPG